jgi:hypothetical protein
MFGAAIGVYRFLRRRNGCGDFIDGGWVGGCRADILAAHKTEANGKAQST